MSIIEKLFDKDANKIIKNDKEILAHIGSLEDTTTAIILNKFLRIPYVLYAHGNEVFDNFIVPEKHRDHQRSCVWTRRFQYRISALAKKANDSKVSFARCKKERRKYRSQSDMP